MRLATFVQRPNPQPPVSEDPADVYEYGVVSAHRLIGPVFVQNGASLKLRGAPGDPVLVRLPRRLSAIRSAEDAISWVRGLDPAPSATVPGLAAAGSAANRWERAYPGRGLGLPKPLQRRRARRVPLTASDLRKRVAKLEAAGYRPMEDGYFHQQLSMEEIFEVLGDTEYQLMERGRVNALPDGCHGQIGNIRIYLRTGVADVFHARMRSLGEATGTALNDLVRRRMEQSRG